MTEEPKDHREQPDFDLDLLRDPDSDPVAHASEWQRLFEHYTPRLDGYFRDRVPDPTDRDDLIAVIWERTVQNLHRLDSPAVFWNWLRRVGENRLVDVHRSRAAERHALEGLGTEPLSFAASVDEDALTRLSADPYFGTGIGPEDLRSRYLSLTEDERNFVLMVLRDRSHKEIAAHLGLASEQASRQRWKRIRERLKAGR